jgi:LysR family transcriptional regulator (chromosome initiation inhibitor)
MIDAAALAAFAAVLRCGSFEAAAASLGITQSAVSQRVKALEHRMGATLIRRTRPATPTDAGQRLFAHAEAVGLLEMELATDLAGLLPGAETPVRIAVTADSLATFVPHALAVAAEAGFLFDLVIDDQAHAADLLRSGEVAAAITLSSTPVQGCTAVALGSLEYPAVCAPAFFARWFTGRVSATTLAAAPALVFNRKDALPSMWAERAAGARVPLRAHYVASTQGITDAAIAGLGWCLNPVGHLSPHLSSGHLVELVPDLRLETPLVWQVPRRYARVLAPLTRALVRAARDKRA